MTVEVGKKVSAFKLPATGEQTISLSSLKGKNVVLYFYPKDNTPGCTQEGQGIVDLPAGFRYLLPTGDRFVCHPLDYER